MLRHFLPELRVASLAAGTLILAIFSSIAFAQDCSSGFASQQIAPEGAMLQNQWERARMLRDPDMMNKIEEKYLNWQRRNTKAFVSDQLLSYRLSNNPSCLLGALSRVGAIDAIGFDQISNDAIMLKSKSGREYQMTKSQLISIAEEVTH